MKFINNVKTGPFEPGVAPDDVHLRLINLTDLHMEIRAYDYFADRKTKAGGLARAASFVEFLRADAPHALVFDNGDILQGNPMGDFAAQEHGRDRHTPHPMITALNALSPDAATVGNHEFNYGLSFLKAALADASYPIVSANLLTRRGATVDQDETLLPPYIVLDRSVADGQGTVHPLKIGVIGLLPPQIMHWDRKHLVGHVQVRGIVETARAYVPQIRAAGADLIVALTHSGIEAVADHPGLENACLPLATVDGIDAIIAGHSHLVFPSSDFDGVENADAESGHLYKVPATMAGFGGSHVGVIDLLLTRESDGWHVRDSIVTTPSVPTENLPTSAVEQTILDQTEGAHVGTLNYIRQPLGQTDIPLESYFAMLEPSASVLFVAAAQASYLRTALDDTADADLPLLSAAAAFKLGGRGGPEHFTDVAAGPVAMRHVADLYSYPNMLCALRVSGEALVDWLEFSASFFRQITPAVQDQTLVDPGFPSYNFDTITGVTYDIDLTQPPRFSEAGKRLNPKADRIRNLCHNGATVTSDMMFIVATNDYRASRSGAFPGADESELVLSAPDTHLEILVRYLRNTADNRVPTTKTWALQPVPGASVMVETGPGALQYPDRLNGLKLEQMGFSNAGFLQLRKWL
ncbi:MAG: bifunctional 2',3'-cyclic-nucleotide 2'-phosphodiesterase/3'-nucleotidase [Pseudomonadota bacterium]